MSSCKAAGLARTAGLMMPATFSSTRKRLSNSELTPVAMKDAVENCWSPIWRCISSRSMRLA